MMYVRFPLSLRNVQDLMDERGIDISHESVRFWWNRFGPMFASEIRAKRAGRLRSEPQWRWHLDEVFVKFNGERRYLWRAVDHEGEVLEGFVTKKRDKKAALKFLKRSLICEAVTRPSLRFVPGNSEEQQAALVLHRSRDLLMRQRTMILNAIQAHMAGSGMITAQGPRKVVDLVRRLSDPDDGLNLPGLARSAVLSLATQPEALAGEISGIERRLMAWHRQNQASQRLETIPRVGIITATALAASVLDPSVFMSGRQFVAWLGLVPGQNSSGGKERSGRVSKMGNGYLRRLLVVGATSATQRRRDEMQGQTRVMTIERARCRDTPRCWKGVTAR